MMSEDLSVKIKVYADAILNSDPRQQEAVCSEIADRFEDDLLEYPEFPPEYFSFSIALLAERHFFSRPGVWNFLLVLGAESDRLRDVHYRTLTKTIIDHYARYDNEDLCLAVCDFIARNVEPHSATLVLEQLMQLEADKPLQLQGFASDALRTVAREVVRSTGSRH